MLGDKLVFTPDPGMNEREFNQLLSNCQQAQLMMDEFARSNITEADLEDALEFFGVDVVSYAETLNHNLSVLGF